MAYFTVDYTWEIFHSVTKVGSSTCPPLEGTLAICAIASPNQACYPDSSSVISGACADCFHVDPDAVPNLNSAALSIDAAANAANLGDTTLALQQLQSAIAQLQWVEQQYDVDLSGPIGDIQYLVAVILGGPNRIAALSPAGIGTLVAMVVLLGGFLLYFRHRQIAPEGSSD